jgi:hypothetical protein
MARLERRVRDCKATSPYLRFAKNVRSQGGEDGVLEALFRSVLVGEEVDSNRARKEGESSVVDDVCNVHGRKYICVDIGAWDGIHLSNTYNLIVNGGWGGVLVEADASRCTKMRELYWDRPDVFCVNEYACFEGPSSLRNLLQRHDVAHDFEFLSIDIDGADYHLWSSLQASPYRPKVVCIEFNPSIPNDILFVQERNSRVNQGCSLMALRELGDQMGYRLVVTTLFNAIFVRKDLASRLEPISDNIDDLHSSSMVTEMFQTYDGELKFVGPRKLIWHRVSINPERMQPLTRKQRQFLYRPGAESCEGVGLDLKPHEICTLDGVVQDIAAAARDLLSNHVLSGEDSSEVILSICDTVKAHISSLVLHCEAVVQLPHCEEAIFDATASPILVAEVILEYLMNSSSADTHISESNVAILVNLVSDMCCSIASFLSGRAETLFRSGGPANVAAFEEARKWLSAAVSALDPAVGGLEALGHGKEQRLAAHNGTCEFYESLCLRCSECSMRLAQQGSGGLGTGLLEAARWRRLGRSRNAGAISGYTDRNLSQLDSSSSSNAAVFAKQRASSFKSMKKALGACGVECFNPLIDGLLKKSHTVSEGAVSNGPSASALEERRGRGGES